LSQPLSQPPPANPAPPMNGADPPKGVWADLIALQTPSSSSSLPLQYQMSSQEPMTVQPSPFSGTMGSYQPSMGTGVNPFQQQHLSSNPYSQQLYQTAGMQASPFSSSATFNPQQAYFSNQTQMQPPMSAPATQPQTNFFQPQPQQGALQIQEPIAGQAIFTSGNGQGGFMSAPPMQGQFLSSSSGQQFQSHSPQPMMSGTPQPQMQMQMMGQPGQFMSPSPQLQQPQMGMGMGTAGAYQGQQFVPNQQDQMQMQSQQQQGFYGAGNMQPQGQFGNFQGNGQPFSTGGFASGQQWGAM